MTIFLIGLGPQDRPGNELASLLSDIVASPHVAEAVPVITCNRVEFYVEGSAGAPAAVLSLLDQPRAAATWTVRRADEASRHLMRVSCGLESVVLGEPQILGQVTAGYQQALTTGTTGPVLSALFQAAIRCGRQARSQTAISRGQVSLSSVALGLARQHVGDLRSKNLVIIGAGQLATLVALQAGKLGVTGIRILNRTPARALALAAQVRGAGAGLGALPEALARADVVVGAVHSRQPLLTDQRLQQACRPARPLAIIDLSAPATVVITPERWPQMVFYDLDEVQRLTARGAAQRQAAVPLVEAIIARENDRLWARLAKRQTAQAVVALRQQAKAVADREVERTLRLLPDADPAVAARIMELAHRLTNKLLHEPTVRLASAGIPESAGHALLRSAATIE